MAMAGETGTSTNSDPASGGTPLPAAAGNAGASPPAPAASSPPANGAAGQPGAPAQADPAASQTPPKPDWREERIRVLTAKVKEANEAKDRAETALAQRANSSQPNVNSPEFNAAVQEAAQSKIAEDNFNASCNAALVAGRTEFTKDVFDSRLHGILQLVDKGDRQSIQMYQNFLTAALRTGKAHQLIHDLGGDLNEAMRVMSMNPLDMAVELTRMSLTRPAAAPPGQSSESGVGVPGERSSAAARESQTPRPLDAQVGNRGSSSSPIDPSDPNRAKDLPSAEWHRRRAEQVAERDKNVRRF